MDRKSPAPPPRSSTSPPPPTPPPVAPTQPRPIQTTEIFLPLYCPSLVRQINENPRYLNQFRNNTKNQFIDELDQYENLGIQEVINIETRNITSDQICLTLFQMGVLSVARAFAPLVIDRSGASH